MRPTSPEQIATVAAVAQGCRTAGVQSFINPSHHAQWERWENRMKRLLGASVSVLFILGLAGTASAECFPLPQPLPETCYRTDSGKCSLGTPGSESTVCTRTDGVIGASLSGTVGVRLIGSGWATWSVPPDAEEPNPLGRLVVGFNQTATLTVTFAEDAYVAGMEIEPNVFNVFNITADFLDASGATIASTTRAVDGRSGARLFGVECTDYEVRAIRITAPLDAQGFAIAQVRSSGFPITAEPGAQERDVVPVDVPQQAISNAD